MYRRGELVPVAKLTETKQVQERYDSAANDTAAVTLDDRTPQLEPRWSFTLRLSFRFAFTYLVLYSFPYPLTAIPGVTFLSKWHTTLWNNIVVWTGTHVLHLTQPIQIALNGSGDRTYDYVQISLILVFALAAMLLWSLLDRKRKNYIYLHQWLRVYVRLVLGATLLSYGTSKVIKTQFPDPSLGVLLEPYGDSSPMGLLWTFMGYSKGL
jgi:hypothetical protein